MIKRGLILAALLISSLSAGEINFQFNPDGVTLDHSSPYIGASFIPQADKWYLIGSNDNYGGGDFDFNDMVVLAGVHADGWMAIIPLANVSGNENQSLKFGNTVINHGDTGMRFVTGVTLGQEFIIQNIVDNMIYQSGPGSRNIDGTPHFWIKQLTEQELNGGGSGGSGTGTGTESGAQTPEPATWGCMLIAGGLAWRKYQAVR